MIRLLVAFFLYFSYSYTVGATQAPVTMCDACSAQQRSQSAASAVSGYGITLIGDRNTGYLYKYVVNVIGPSFGVLPPGITQAQPTNAQAEEFMLYADAYRAGGVGVIDLEARITQSAQPLPPAFPNSAFDVTQDGAARNALISHVANTDNWPWLDSRMFYAKLIIQHGKTLMTSGEFTIRVTSTFSDGSKVVLNYDSAKQALVFVEARDSAGNLIATSSNNPVQVDYSWYETDAARGALDFDRGLQWLRNQGVIFVNGNGGYTVRNGTVLVGGVVTVAQ